VAIFSNSITRQVRFSLSERDLTISSEDIEIGGEAKENIPIEYSDIDMEIGYNASYIIEMLRHIDSDTVKIEFKSPLSATIIKATEENKDENLLMLVMPIRLSDEVESNVAEEVE
jgi:DNA polymerase-3 subunit beta